MKRVFADTAYWIAVTRPNDQWSEIARRAKADLGSVRLVTTDEVLVEFLAALSKEGKDLRVTAVKIVRTILQNADVSVLPQTRDSFLRGVELYESRADKQYSLTDCISMNAMTKESLSQVLSNDYHFEQEGFAVLMKRAE